MNTNLHWYLLYCKPKQELRAQQHLANQGFTSFVPQITLDKLRGGKWQQVTEPLFPRYLFLHISNAEQLNFRAIRATRGITDFVRFGSALATVPDQLVQQLTAEQWAQQVQLFGQFTMSREQAIQKCFEHQTHHRGQTTVYLRLAGAIPPPEQLF